MSEKQINIERFMHACTGLIEGKYNEAGEGIRNVLAAIASNHALVEMFTAVVHGFDYAQARGQYLRFPADKGSAHGAAFLPPERDRLVAFVFCLLVDIDGGAILLDDFLLRYFYVDGSYTASFSVFAERVIRPFRDIVGDCFPSAGEANGAFGHFAELLSAERTRIGRYALREEEKDAAELLLSRLFDASARLDSGEIGALMVGYRYLLRYFGGEDASTEELFRATSEL